MPSLSRVLTCAAALAGGVFAAELPLLKLPYGTWQASKYDEAADVYTFRNIRFAAPPVGALRFADPASPEPVEGIQDGSYGYKCLQLTDTGAVRDGAGEDCLFLDLYVPGAALKEKRPKTDLSVMIYIFGGSYTSGSKDAVLLDGLYDGTGFVKESRGDSIVVVPNYRLGVLGGWVGGPTAIEAGATSLGLADQRAALQWIQDNIRLVNGNPSDVTIMGQSAGGGSIMHQITQLGGQRDPLFQKAIIQSPGWADVWNKTQAENAFQNFAANAGCPGADFDCLRAAPLSAIAQGQAKWSGSTLTPTPDGKWILDHSAFELEKGNYWKNLTSLVVTHVINEGGLFVAPVEPSEAAITAQLKAQYVLDEVVADIESFYPPVGSTGSPYTTNLERLTAIISDSIFLHNYRRIADAFAGKGWAMSRTRDFAGHGDDVRPTWYNPTLVKDGKPLPEVLGDAVFSQAWQSYLISFIVKDDVNRRRNSSTTIHWPHYSKVSQDRLRTLNLGEDGWKVIQDTLGTKAVASFWSKQLKRLANASQ